MKVCASVLECVGRTPMVQLSRIVDAEGLQGEIWAKVESFNPGGSAKDRVAVEMIEEAERQGKLRPGGTLIEPTSGNTGVGLALVCALRSFHLILTMPETMSLERRKLVAAYGAEVVLTPAAEGMAGAIAEAERLCRRIEGSLILQQFDNPANPQAHYKTTAEEIWKDTEGCFDAFVASVGTGGTLCGTARRLKEYKPSLKVIGVEPAASPVLNGGVAASHKIQGIGANFVPGNYDASCVDEVMTVSDEAAYVMARRLAREEGLLSGISSGGALCAALDWLRRPENAGSRVVVVLPDTGERYLSTDLFEV